MSKLPIVERLEALMAAATKGPYRAHDHNSMARVGEKPENWIGYAWVGRIKENSGPDGSFDAGWLDLDRRKDGCKEYRERASADAHFVAEALNALPELLTTITELVSALEECQQAFDWIRAQAENAMSTSAGCATTHGDPGGGLEMVNSYASDIAANAEMAGAKLVTALSNTRGDTKNDKG